MDPIGLFLGLPGIVALGYAAWNRWQDDAHRTRRVLRRTRVTPIAELGDGLLACVVGTVELDEPLLLTSMIAKRPCVVYDTNVYFFAGNTAGMPSRREDPDRRQRAPRARERSRLSRASLSRDHRHEGDADWHCEVPAADRARALTTIHVCRAEAGSVSEVHAARSAGLFRLGPPPRRLGTPTRSISSADRSGLWS